MKTRVLRQSLRIKLLLGLLALSLASLLSVGLFSYLNGNKSLVELQGKALLSQAQTAAQAFDDFLEERRVDLNGITNAMWATGSAEEVRDMANLFVTSNDYYDLMLEADKTGDVIASNTVSYEGKKLDGSAFFGYNVKNTDWFKKCTSGAIKKGECYISDADQDPEAAILYKTPRRLTINLSQPIFDSDGTVVRVWSNRLSFDRTAANRLNRIQQNLMAAGSKGITVRLVSAKGALLYDTSKKPDETSTPDGFSRSGLKSVQQVVLGESGYITERNPLTRLDEIIGYARCIGKNSFKGVGWGVLVHQDKTETIAPALGGTFFTGVITLGLVGLISMMFANTIVRPVTQTVEVFKDVATGDFSPRLKVQSRDEIGEMAGALNSTLEKLSGTVNDIRQTVQNLTASSDEMKVVSTTMRSGAEETSSMANVVATASEQINLCIQTAATATEEMTSTIKEIAQNASGAVRVANDGVNLSSENNKTIEELARKSADIGEVVNVITTIAQQTNLLALNATIEAARAGEAGRGFAVVAHEVKDLANESAKATEVIRNKIAAIQESTRNVIHSNGQITAIINQINEFQTSIVSAVEEQSATTNEMSRNLSEAARGSSQIAVNIAGVAQAAAQTTASANETDGAATKLARLAVNLSALVGQFKTGDSQIGASAEPDRAPVPAFDVKEPLPNRREETTQLTASATTLH